MVTAYVGLGSNLGDGAANLRGAWARLAAVPGVTVQALSRPYRSSPVGMASRQWFTNAVGRLATTLEAHALLAVLLAIEKDMGRDRSLGPDRVVDLDLLLYGEAVIATPDLFVPHPRLAERLFVLVPLAELAPQLVIPGADATVEALLARRTAAPGEQQLIATTWEAT